MSPERPDPPKYWMPFDDWTAVVFQLIFWAGVALLISLTGE